jgi:hypothetical protein
LSVYCWWLHLTIHLCLVTSIGMSGAIHLFLLYAFMASEGKVLTLPWFKKGDLKISSLRIIIYLECKGTYISIIFNISWPICVTPYTECHLMPIKSEFRKNKCSQIHSFPKWMIFFQYLIQFFFLFCNKTLPLIYTRACWYDLTPGRKETSYSDPTRDLFNILPPRSSIHILARCSTFANKKKSECCPSN